MCHSLGAPGPPSPRWLVTAISMPPPATLFVPARRTEPMTSKSDAKMVSLLFASIWLLLAQPVNVFNVSTPFNDSMIAAALGVAEFSK